MSIWLHSAYVLYWLTMDVAECEYSVDDSLS